MSDVIRRNSARLFDALMVQPQEVLDQLAIRLRQADVMGLIQKAAIIRKFDVNQLLTNVELHVNAREELKEVRLARVLNAMEGINAIDEIVEDMREGKNQATLKCSCYSKLKLVYSIEYAPTPQIPDLIPAVGM